MACYRLQTSFQCDTAFPRDRIVINPVFNDTSGGTGTENLVEDLVNGLDSILSTFTGEIQCRAYDAEAEPPVYPDATFTKRPGAFQTTAYPRELAVCLSFYSEHNRPRTRGRLYLPAFLVNTSQGLRPQGYLPRINQLVDLFTNLGGMDVDWSIYSQVDGRAMKVTNWWVDDEWDVIRSRGLRATKRDLGTTSE